MGRKGDEKENKTDFLFHETDTTLGRSTYKWVVRTWVRPRNLYFHKFNNEFYTFLRSRPELGLGNLRGYFEVLDWGSHAYMDPYCKNNGQRSYEIG